MRLRYQALIDLIEGIRDRWTEDHQPNEHDTPAEYTDRKSGDQHRTDRFSPVKPIHCFNSHNVQGGCVNTYGKTKETNTYPHDRYTA